MASWGSFISGLVIFIQFLLCYQLYTTQVLLVARLDSLDSQYSFGYAVERSRREVRSAGDSAPENLLPSAENATTESSLPESTTRRRHHRKSHRLPVERHTISTESTTMGPIMVRVSRTKMTSRSRAAPQKIAPYEAAALREEPEPVISSEFVPPPSLPPAAIHFLSDSSNYTRQQHPHYAGNGRIKVSGVYTDWSAAQWAHALGSNQHFRMTQGKVTVRQPGLYLLYAQIHYANVQEVNCFRAIQNGATIAQCCSTTAHPDRHEIKANTCSLLTTVYLQPDDTLWLADLHERYVILTPEKSYFGLVQLYSPPN